MRGLYESKIQTDQHPKSTFPYSVGALSEGSLPTAVKTSKNFLSVFVGTLIECKIPRGISENKMLAAQAFCFMTCLTSSFFPRYPEATQWIPTRHYTKTNLNKKTVSICALANALRVGEFQK
jgi:hypothetical protein